MEITLEFNTRIKKFDKVFKGKKSKIVDLPDDTSVSELLKKESIPENFVAMVSINDKYYQKDSKLKDKDKVKLYPPICGG